MEVRGYKPLEYSLRIRPQGLAYTIAEETLSQQRRPQPPPHFHITSHGPADIKYFDPESKHLVPPNWEVSGAETSLSQVPKMFREPEDFRHRLASSTFYHDA